MLRPILTTYHGIYIVSIQPQMHKSTKVKVIDNFSHGSIRISDSPSKIILFLRNSSQNYLWYWCSFALIDLNVVLCWGASQLVTAQNRMTSWPAAETPCCDELTGTSNAVLSLLWRVDRTLLSAYTQVLCSVVPILTTFRHWVWSWRFYATMLFTLLSAQFLVHFLSNGGNRGLRVRVIILLRQYGFDVCLFVCLWRVDCLFVTSWPCDELTCDELTVWWVDRVTSWPCDELTCDKLTVWRVDRVTSWPGDELTVWRVDWQPYVVWQMCRWYNTERLWQEET